MTVSYMTTRMDVLSKFVSYRMSISKTKKKKNTLLSLDKIIRKPQISHSISRVSNNFTYPIT